MRQRARRRLRIALVAILCLLFQQLALAAYACPVQQRPAETAPMSAHCAGMGMPQAEVNPALCGKHCAPDVATPADQAKLSVPALALPPLMFAPILVSCVDRFAACAAIPLERSDPPPRLRFCSLLI